MDDQKVMGGKTIGGLSSIGYSLKVASKVGYANFWRAVSSRNACKTWADGMGGQRGGMINESGTWLEICKKSIQAQLTDIQEPISEDVFKHHSIEQLKEKSGMELEMLGRLNFPIYKKQGGSHFSRITWDDAMDRVAEKFQSASPDKTFFYSSGRSSNEAGFILQLFARLYGTNNVNNCSYYCHQASGVGLNNTIGSGTATIQLEDLKHTDLIFVIGANPSSNHPRFLTELMHCRRRGGKVVIVNPAKEPGLVRFAIPSDVRSMVLGGSPIASDYIQPNIGGDIALLKGIAKVIIKTSLYNTEFIRDHTNGYDAYSKDVLETSWEDIVQSSGIRQEVIEKIAAIYCRSKSTVFAWSMGITHHKHGVDNVESIVNLALLRGMVGRKYAGLLPLRGHSNVQGIGSVGVTPALKEQVFKNIQEQLAVKLPEKQGMDTMACMEAAYDNKISCAFLLGGNLYGSNPDSKFAELALSRIPFKVYLNTTLNIGHVFGNDQEVVILPCAARDEEYQPTTQESMFNFVRKSDGGIVRLDNVRPETDIICDLASRVLNNGSLRFNNFKKHRNIREAIAKTIPGFEKLTQLEHSKDEFQIEGRTFHQPYFNTKDKKGNFQVVNLPEATNMGTLDFKLMTVRSEGQFNTIVYEEKDLFRGQNDRWVVMMNPKDMVRLSLKEGDKVSLSNETGRMDKLVLREFDVKEGNLMAYFPEANCLVPSTIDKRSKTPGFKSVIVRVIC